MAARRREAKRRHWPANLYQNSAGYFYWRNPDTKKDYGIGRDQAKAFGEARAANAELESSRGYRSVVQRMTAPDEKTLLEWSTEYQKIYEETRNPTASTMQTVRAGLRVVLKAPFADKHLRKIQTREIAEFLDGIDKPNMAKLARKTLSDMMRVAETKGIIDSGKNPVSVTRTPEITVERSNGAMGSAQFRISPVDRPASGRRCQHAFLRRERRISLRRSAEDENEASDSAGGTHGCDRIVSGRRNQALPG
jgi:hypothetical protein